MISVGLRAAPFDFCFRQKLSVCSVKLLKSITGGGKLAQQRQISKKVHSYANADHCVKCLHLESRSTRNSLHGSFASSGCFGLQGINQHQIRLFSESGQNSNTANRRDMSNFSEKENEYFHSFLEGSCEYRPYLLISVTRNRNATDLSDEDLKKELKEVRKGHIEALFRVLEHWSITASKGHDVPADPLFSTTVRLLGRRLTKLSTEQLIGTMAHISRMGFRDNEIAFDEARKNRILLSKMYNKICCKMLGEFEVRELFLAADLFYALRGSAFTEFPQMVCQKLKHLLPTLTKTELILLLFQVSLTKTVAPGLIEDVMKQLEDSIMFMSLPELGIINLAHYKTQSTMRLPAFFKALPFQLKQDTKRDVDPILLSAVMKYQQKSLNKKKETFLPEFFSMMEEIEMPLMCKFPQLPPATMMHILNLYYSLDLLSEDLYEAVVLRILEQGLEEWRIKDIARVTHVLGNIPLFGENRLEALEKIVEELGKPERDTERQLFYGSMLQVAIALTVCGIYPHWLIQEILCEESQKKFRGSDIDWRRDLFHLSESVLIEDGRYDGPILNPENFPKLSRSKVYGMLKGKSVRSMAGKDTISQRDWALLDIMDNLRYLQPQLPVQPVFMLPHFQAADIEILPQLADGSLYAKWSPVQADHLEPADTGVVLHANNAFQTIKSHDGRMIHLLRQYHAMRARQLRKLGVTVVEVSYADFMGTNNKGQYLQHRFADCNALGKLRR